MKTTITQEMIDMLLEKSEIKTHTFWDKTTVVSCKLGNGFVLTESSSCVDPANYNEEMGKKICLERIKNKLWELEGYRLQGILYWRNIIKDSFVRFTEEHGHGFVSEEEIEHLAKMEEND